MERSGAGCGGAHPKQDTLGGEVFIQGEMSLTLSSHYGNLRSVRIVTEKQVRDFIKREPRSAEVLWRWVDVIETSSWRNPTDLRRTFAAASFVGDLTVFNVGGNKYRIAVFVHYAKQIVYVKAIGTHEEYDKWDL